MTRRRPSWLRPLACSSRPRAAAAQRGPAPIHACRRRAGARLRPDRSPSSRRRRRCASPAARIRSSGASSSRATCDDQRRHGQRHRGRPGVLRPPRRRPTRRAADQPRATRRRSARRLDPRLRGGRPMSLATDHPRLRHHRSRRLPRAVRAADGPRRRRPTRRKPQRDNYGRVCSAHDRRASFGTGDFFDRRPRQRPRRTPGTHFVSTATSSRRTTSCTSWARRWRWTCRPESSTLQVTVSRDAITRATTSRCEVEADR